MYAGSKKYTCWAKTLPVVLQSYGSEGLQLVEHSEIVLSGQAVLQLTFDPGAFGRAPVTVRCQLDHPFYVKNKGGSSRSVYKQPAWTPLHPFFFASGWSSFYPSLTVVRHGIPCYEMEMGVLCLPPGHRDAKHADNSLVFNTFRR